MDVKYKLQKRNILASRVKLNLPEKDKSKVHVQFIENRRIIEKNNVRLKTPTGNFAPPTPWDTEIEGENVEYLDESISDQSTKFEQPNGNKSTTNSVFQPVTKPIKDIFYPNAIHCLIDLYKRKYVQIKGKNEEEILAMNIWDQIAEDMNECLFHFNRLQIKEKFIQLRTQYFGVKNSQDADEFEYFDQLHELYQDKYIDAIAAGVFKREDAEEKLQTVYCDEVIIVDDHLAIGKQNESEEDSHLETTKSCEEMYHLDAAQEVIVHTSNDEIEHKEQEFIDMVEKEMRAIFVDEEGSGVTAQEIVTNNGIDHQQEAVIALCGVGRKKNKHTPSVLLERGVINREEHIEPVKRLKLDTKPFNVGSPINLHVPPVPQKHYRNDRELHLANKTSAEENTEMSLADYNSHQERRHREKIELLHRIILLQERSLNVHRELMQELIKR